MLVLTHADNRKTILSMKEQFDVVIVGGGMVGAAVACGLGDSALRVAVIEQHTPDAFSAEQPHDLRVSALSIASKKILETVGAWDGVINRRSCAFKRMRVWETAGNTEFCSDAIDYPELGYIVENRVTQLALLERLAAFKNITLFCPVSIQKIDYNPLSTGDTASIRSRDRGLIVEQPIICSKRSVKPHHMVKACHLNSLFGP